MTAATDKRRSYILDELRRKDFVRVAELSEHFSISQVSIRRDLEKLERLGLITRIHGGATLATATSPGQARPVRQQHHVQEKQRIGRRAAQLIKEGDRIILDSGTTVFQLARNIPQPVLNAGNLTITSPSIQIVQELGRWKGVHFILVGGIYLPDYDIAVGPQAIYSLTGLTADQVFLGSDGISLTHGVTTANVLEAEVDRAMIAAASEVTVLADSSKLGIAGLTPILPVDRIHRLITDEGAPADFVADLRRRGVEVILC
jgi:DeoR/GlpR family transcriptional regulator of sugar metabolism